MDPQPTHVLSNVRVSRMTLVKKGANRQRFFLRKSADEAPEAIGGSPAELLKGSSDWRTAYVVVAAPGWVEAGGQGAEGVHDVWKSEDEIERAAHDFMAAGGDVNRLVHGSPTDPVLKVVENAVALSDFTVGGATIAKGSWYVGLRLDDEAREMVEKGEITGVSIEGTGLRAEIGKAAPSDRSVMVALYPPADVANALAIDGGEHPADLHLTLAYLGDVSDDRLHLVVEAVEAAVEQVDIDGLSGEIAGAGTFVGGEKPVHYASVDAPSLPALREQLVTYLRSRGVPAREDHGYTPHMTLKYGRGATPRVTSRPVTFGEVHVVRGDRDVATVPLRPNRVPVTPMAKGSLDRSPKKNWVENAGGLPKFIEEIAEALHTKRGMNISRAIATAVSRVKVWAAGGDNVNPDTRAKAQKALAEWESKRARTKMNKTLEIIGKAFGLTPKTDALTAEEEEILLKAIDDPTRSGEDPATLGKTNPGKETNMDPKELGEAVAAAVAKAMEPVTEKLAAIEKAQAAAPKPEAPAPTVESVEKSLDELTEAFVGQFKDIQKSLDALTAGGSTQEPSRGGEAPVKKSDNPMAGIL